MVERPAEPGGSDVTAPTGVRPADRSRADRRAALGWRLQLVRAAVWEGAATGDPYLRLLCDAEDDPTPALVELIARGPVHRSVAGNTVVSDPTVARELLGDDRLGTRGPDGARALLQVMELRGAHVDDLDATGDPWPVPSSDDLDRLVRDAIADWSTGRGPAARDLAAAAREVAVRVVAQVTGTSSSVLGQLWPRLSPALDALLTPQRLDDAWELNRSVPLLRLLLREVGTDVDAESVRVGALIVWAGVLETAVLSTVGPTSQPAVRLVARVAREPMQIGGLDVAAGDQVVLVDPGDAGLDLLSAAGAAYSAAAPLVGAVVEAARSAWASMQMPGGLGDPVRARRAPVTRRIVSLPVREATA